MIYSLSSSGQINNFFSALGLGFLLAVLYFVILFIRSVISTNKISFLIQDIMFSISATFLTFCFLQVYSYGEVRADLILAEWSGFGMSVYWFSSLVGSAFKKSVSVTKSFYKAFFAPLRLLFVPVRIVFKKAGLLIHKIKAKCRENKVLRKEKSNNKNKTKFKNILKKKGKSV